MSAAIVLHTWQAAADVISSAVTAVAIVVGGIWACWRFVRERTRWPRADLAISFTERQLDEKQDRHRHPVRRA